MRWITELARLINRPSPYGWPYWETQWADGLKPTRSPGVSAQSKWPYFKFMIRSGLRPRLISSLKSVERSVLPWMTSSATPLWLVSCQISGWQMSGPLPWRDFQLVECSWATEDAAVGTASTVLVTKKRFFCLAVRNAASPWGCKSLSDKTIRCRLATSQLYPQAY